MKTTVRKTAARPKAGAGKWFVPHGSRPEKPTPADWRAVEDFNPGPRRLHLDGLFLYLDGAGKVWLKGSDPYHIQLSLPDALAFYADMSRQSYEGGNHEAHAAFFRLIAKALRKAGVQ
jgi:hypothetical protein